MTLHKVHRQFFNLLRWLMNRWIIRWIETVVSIIRTILSMYLRNFITNANNGHPPYQKKPKSPNPQTTQNWLVINKIDRVAHYVIYELGHFKVWYYNGRLTYFTIHCTCWRTNDDSTMHFILLQSATINATLPPPARVAMLGDACGSGSRIRLCVVDRLSISASKFHFFDWRLTLLANLTFRIYDVNFYRLVLEYLVYRQYSQYISFWRSFNW